MVAELHDVRIPVVLGKRVESFPLSPTSPLSRRHSVSDERISSFLVEFNVGFGFFIYSLWIDIFVFEQDIPLSVLPTLKHVLAVVDKGRSLVRIIIVVNINWN